jgi:hypothetical protein
MTYRAAGIGIHKIAKLAGIGVSIVQRIEAVRRNEYLRL